MPTLTKPKPDVDNLLAHVMSKFHGVLDAAGVTVGLLRATPNETEDHAVKLHGYACAAVVKITPYEKRVMGLPDAVITFDGVAWEGFSPAERIALFDHELNHLELRFDKEGTLKTDDCGRPKLKMRLHDWELGGFAVVADRHKGAALEVQGFRAAHAAYYQQIFAWGDDNVTGSAPNFSGLGPSDITRDVFAALLSVGHTEDQARNAIEAVGDMSRFASVSEVVEAIYQLSLDGAGNRKPKAREKAEVRA